MCLSPGFATHRNKVVAEAKSLEPPRGRLLPRRRRLTGKSSLVSEAELRCFETSFGQNTFKVFPKQSGDVRGIRTIAKFDMMPAEEQGD